MPIVTTSLGVSKITNDPSNPNEAYVDLAMLLSEKYGKLVRQGHKFTITGIQARLVPESSGYDVGQAISGSMGFMPVTKHSRKAWNQAFLMWKRQKQLASSVGSPIKHDDFEMCWDLGGKTSRTSLIFATGMGDDISAPMGLFGASDESGIEQYFSLTDFYNSNNPVSLPSKKHWNDSPYKQPKYSTTMPSAEYAYFSSTLSTTHSDNPTTLSLFDDALSGAISHSDIVEFPQAVNSLAGLLKFTWYTIPDDTTTQNEGDDDARVDFAIFVKTWKPLAYKPRRKARRKPMYRARTRRYSGSRSRRKYRGRRR